jgi:hypothetical protein
MEAAKVCSLGSVSHALYDMWWGVLQEYVSLVPGFTLGPIFTGTLRRLPMSPSRKFARALVTALAVVGFFVHEAFAQDIDAMAKWTAEGWTRIYTPTIVR